MLIKPHVMRYFAMLSLSLLVVLSSCSSSSKTGSSSNSNKYFPAELAGLDFNMPMEEVLKKRGLHAADAVDGTFRYEVLETVERNGIEFIGYYFDAEGNRPFYEVIIGYNSAAERDSEAARLFGKPNYEEETEWMMETKKGYRIHAWTFKNKLVIVGKIAGTEWQELE